MLRPKRQKHIPDRSKSDSHANAFEASTGMTGPHQASREGKKEKIVTQPALRLGHEQLDPKHSIPRPSRSSPLPWNRAVPTHRRERATEGLLIGCAVAEALSLSRNELHPRVALKMFGRNPLGYQFQPGVGVTSHRTHSLLMSFQALLQSKTDPKIFAANVKKRIAWYQRAFMFRHAYTHLKRMRSRNSPLRKDTSITIGLADDPLMRSMAMSVVLQGVADSATTWFQLSAGISHADPRALHVSTLVGYAAQLAQMTDHEEFDPEAVLKRLIDVTEEPTLNAALLQLQDALAKKQTLSKVAKGFGWKDGLPNSLFASATIGIYAWLRHSNRYRNAVERTILLGGCCSNAAAVAGGLSGISLGRKAIPPEWLKKLSLRPHTGQWQEMLIERIKDWPHGVEDIHRTRALPSMLLGQLTRNAIYSGFRILHGAIRMPLRMTQFSLVKHLDVPHLEPHSHRLLESGRPVTDQ